MVHDADTIISYLKLPSHEAILRDKWIDGNDLCAAISIIFDLKDNNFALKQFTKALSTKRGKVIKDQIDVDIQMPVSLSHIGISHQVYRPRKGTTKKTSGMVYACYFTTIRGTNPPTYNDEWYNHIVDFTELLPDVKKTDNSNLIVTKR